MKNEDVKNLEPKKRKRRSQNSHEERVDRNGLLSRRWSRYVQAKFEVFSFLQDCGVMVYTNFPNQGSKKARKKKIEKQQWDTLKGVIGKPPNVVLRWKNQNSPKVGGSSNFDNLHDAVVFALTTLGLDPSDFNIPPKKMDGLYPNDHELFHLLGTDYKVVVEEPVGAARTNVGFGLVEHLKGSNEIRDLLPSNNGLRQLRDNPNPKPRQKLEQTVIAHLQEIVASVAPTTVTKPKRNTVQGVLPLTKGTPAPAPANGAASKVAEHLRSTVFSMKEGLVAEVARIASEHKPLSEEVAAMKAKEEALIRELTELKTNIAKKSVRLEELAQSLVFYQQMEEDVDRRLAELDPKHNTNRAMRRMEDQLKNLK